jgi:hypothetical protein
MRGEPNKGLQSQATGFAGNDLQSVVNESYCRRYLYRTDCIVSAACLQLPLCVSMSFGAISSNLSSERNQTDLLRVLVSTM